MSARSSRRMGSKNSSQETVIGILLLIVMVETFLLVRPYLKQKPGIRRAKPQHAAVRPEVHRKPGVVPIPSSPVIPPPLPPVPPKPFKSEGKIAIIIDDNGYNSGDCDNLSKIPQSITISILPDLEFSKQTAYCAHMERKEIMLHLPMEPHMNQEGYPDNYIIKTKMSNTDILARLREALDNVPHTAGVNNHMGSKATEDKRVMTLVLKELKSRGLFFVDSLVTSKSVCRSIARRLKIPFAERDIFLDNIESRPYIQNQFVLLAQKARRNGQAIGIGHARPLSWRVIREEVEKLTQEGFEIVPASEILQTPAP